MKEARPIFLYLKSCDIGQEALNELILGGYIPIAVETMDDVKVLDAVTVGLSHPISKIAFGIISSSAADSVRQTFAREVTKLLLQTDR